MGRRFVSRHLDYHKIACLMFIADDVFFVLVRIRFSRGRLKNFQTTFNPMLKYRVIIEKDEDGIFVARVPDLPGCATEGRTREELMKNVKEAIQAYLEALKQHGEPVPIETVQVSV